MENYSNLKNPMEYVNGSAQLPGVQVAQGLGVQTPASQAQVQGAQAQGAQSSDNFNNTVNGKLLTMENIMEASFGEVANDLTVNFKKTVLVRNYETEVIEATTSLKLDKSLTGIERMLVQALLEVQMEYTVYVNLYFKGTITATQFNEHRSFLENSVNSIKTKMDTLLGEEAAKQLIEYTNLNKQ